MTIYDCTSIWTIWGTVHEFCLDSLRKKYSTSTDSNLASPEYKSIALNLCTVFSDSPYGSRTHKYDHRWSFSSHYNVHFCLGNKNDPLYWSNIYIYIYINKGCDLFILHEAKYDCDPEAARLGNKTIFCPKIMFGIILRDEKNHTPRLLWTIVIVILARWN